MSTLLKIAIPKSAEHALSASLQWQAALWQALPKTRLRRLFGLQEHVALEIVGQPGRIHFQLWAPGEAAARTMAEQLRAHVAEIAITPVSDEIPDMAAWASAELTLGLSRERPLRILKDHEADPMAGLLASLSVLAVGEWRLLQILVRPGLDAQLGAATFQAIIRLLAGAGDAQRARNQLGSLIAAFGPFAAANALKPLRVQLNSRDALDEIRNRHWPLLRQHGFTLTLEELAAIYHLPNLEKVHHPHLEVVGAHGLPPQSRLPASGARVGLAQGGGREQVVRLAPRDLLRHTAVLGATGTGKSTLLQNLALDLIALGAGVSLMDPHGTLIPPLLAALPERRLEEVALIRFSDTEYPVGLNFLSARPGLEFLTVDELVEACQRIYGADSWGPVLDMVLRHAATAAIESGGTLVEAARILDDDHYRDSVLPRVRNGETRRFLQQLSAMRPGAREQKVASTLHRLQRFLGTPLIRNIVGQTRSTIELRQAMDQRQIVLFDLSGIGVTNAQFLGSLLTLLYRQAALSREGASAGRLPPHFLFMDECSWFISRTVGEMTDQVRKFGLGLILAAQRLGQLKPVETREAVFANVSSLIAFQMGDQAEAQYLERHLNTPGLTAQEIQALGNYEVYAQLLQEGAKLPAFWARTPPPPTAVAGSRERLQLVIRRSRERYALPRQRVEDEIAARERSEGHGEPEKRRR
jgi:hypothetical protein